LIRFNKSSGRRVASSNKALQATSLPSLRAVRNAPELERYASWGVSVTSTNFLQYYDLEGYLFSVVSSRYAQKKTLSAFDFFCIVIWKANRAKSKVADRLLAHDNGHANLEAAVGTLLAAISTAEDNKARLSVLIVTWGFRLPMASAILSVLYPEEFTVYDIRVCDVLGDFKDAQYKTNFTTRWDRYSAYVAAVRSAVPEHSSLRDKDRFLWGKSFATQLQNDIQSSFSRENGDAEFEA
jgi:hypothetical protein